MNNISIAFIGCGNMARSLIGGLIADGCDPVRIQASDPSPSQRDALTNQFGIRTTADNDSAAGGADIVVLSVKPQILKQVSLALSDTVQRTKPLVISIAAGVREFDLSAWLGGEVPLVRTMPNTPALVGSGATALYANPLVSTIQRQRAESVLRAVGVTVWVEHEAQLDAVTALSGSGPAYFFLVMEALEQAGLALGLAPEHVRLLTLQTALGAAKMAMESAEGPATLRTRVTSPGGTTERAVAVLQEGRLEQLFVNALQAACQRSKELGELLGNKS
jgi:pyrroline-5-carboxylate reductase